MILVCTGGDMAKLKQVFIKTDVMQMCTREQVHIEKRTQRLTNLTVFAALLEDVALGSRVADIQTSFKELNSEIQHF